MKGQVTTDIPMISPTPEPSASSIPTIQITPTPTVNEMLEFSSTYNLTFKKVNETVLAIDTATKKVGKTDPRVIELNNQYVEVVKKLGDINRRLYQNTPVSVDELITLSQELVVIRDKALRLETKNIDTEAKNYVKRGEIATYFTLISNGETYYIVQINDKNSLIFDQYIDVVLDPAILDRVLVEYYRLAGVTGSINPLADINYIQNFYYERKVAT